MKHFLETLKEIHFPLNNTELTSLLVNPDSHQQKTLQC